MKLGFNLLLWTPHVTAEHEPLLRALKKTGYDGVELPMFEGDPDHYARIGELLDRIGLERTVVSVMPQGHNPLSPDKAEQQAAVARAKWAIDCTAALGAPILAGPMHSEHGYFSGNPPRLRCSRTSRMVSALVLVSLVSNTSLPVIVRSDPRNTTRITRPSLPNWFVIQRRSN